VSRTYSSPTGHSWRSTGRLRTGTGTPSAHARSPPPSRAPRPRPERCICRSAPRFRSFTSGRKRRLQLENPYQAPIDAKSPLGVMVVERAAEILLQPDENYSQSCGIGRIDRVHIRAQPAIATGRYAGSQRRSLSDPRQSASSSAARAQARNVSTPSAIISTSACSGRRVTCAAAVELARPDLPLADVLPYARPAAAGLSGPLWVPCFGSVGSWSAGVSRRCTTPRRWRCWSGRRACHQWRASTRSSRVGRVRHRKTGSSRWPSPSR
jgi:hypothetical protein